MPASRSTPLNAAQILIAQQNADSVGTAGVWAIRPEQFVFLAALDGTNNTKDNPAFSGDSQSTSAGQLWEQADLQRAMNPNLRVAYFPGPGTPGTLVHSSFNPAMVTQQLRNTADLASQDFREQALTWLAADPSRSPHDITTVAMGFQISDQQAMAWNQLDLLVQAMAAFAPPPMGQTTLSADRHAALMPVIASSWV